MPEMSAQDLTAFNQPWADTSLIACPHCDLLQRRPASTSPPLDQPNGNDCETIGVGCFFPCFQTD
jgi:hypothetical protein